MRISELRAKEIRDLREVMAQYPEGSADWEALKGLLDCIDAVPITPEFDLDLEEVQRFREQVCPILRYRP